MIIIGAVAAVLVVGAGLAWAITRTGVPGVADPVATHGAVTLPPGPVTSADIAAVRFDQAFRGYRMSQVDDVLELLGTELADRDAEITRLRAEADRRTGTAVPGRGEHDERG